MVEKIKLKSDEFKDLYLSLPNVKLAERLNVTLSEIDKIRRQLGLSKPKGRKPKKDKNRLEIEGD